MGAAQCRPGKCLRAAGPAWASAGRRAAAAPPLGGEEPSGVTDPSRGSCQGRRQLQRRLSETSVPVFSTEYS